MTSVVPTTANAGGGPEYQRDCFLGGVYNAKSDSCISIFKTQPESYPLPDFAPKAEMRIDVKVLSVITIKKGDTCIKVTGLSLKQCIEMGLNNGRETELFIAPDGKRTFDVPLYIGERLSFIRYMKDGETRVDYVLSRKKRKRG